MSKIDRIKGLIYGMAAGDKNKGPFFMSLKLLESILVNEGSYSGKMALCAYLNWYRNRETGWYDTGPTSANIFRSILATYPDWIENHENIPEDKLFEQAKLYDEVSGGMSGGVNAAHRSSVLSLLPFFQVGQQVSIQKLVEIAFQESKLTHFSPLSQQTTAAVVLLCHHLLQDFSWENSTKMTLSHVQEDSKVAEALKNRSWIGLERGGFCVDVLKAAVYFVENETDFQSSLLSSLKFAGGANYCPVLVGALAGCRYGFDSISEKNLSHWSLRDLECAEKITNQVLNSLKISNS